MAEPLSPLGASGRPGRYGNRAGGVGVTIGETRPAAIVEAVAWPGVEARLAAVISKAIDLEVSPTSGCGVFAENCAAFGIGPGRFLVVDQNEGLLSRLGARVVTEIGTVCDLSHGRTAIRIEGVSAEWVLSKLYPLDFSSPAFGIGQSRASAHHDIATAIQRTGPQQFDLFVPRSFARSFWHALCQAAEEVGYEVT